jgi:hypothetical protein
LPGDSVQAIQGGGVVRLVHQHFLITLLGPVQVVAGQGGVAGLHVARDLRQAGLLAQFGHGRLANGAHAPYGQQPQQCHDTGIDADLAPRHHPAARLDDLVGIHRARNRASCRACSISRLSG